MKRFLTDLGIPLHAPPPARTPLPAVRPSACPGLLRIVQALDGGICRIKLPGGVLSAEQAEAVALAAQRHAGGVIEVTNRANLQIRGVRGDSAPLIEALLGAGLGPRDTGADDVRNLMLSPAAGIDCQQLLDVRPLAAMILASLEHEPRYHQLSAKFAIQLDGGEALAMLEHHHDVWLSPVQLDGTPWMAFGLAGCPGLDAPEGAVPLEQAHALVLAVLDSFLRQATDLQHRLRDLFQGNAAQARRDFVNSLGLAVRGLTWHRAAAPQSPVGVHPQPQPGRCQVAALAPLGRLTPAQLQGAAAVARAMGGGSLRMTPWQGLLLDDVAVVHGQAALAELAALGLLTTPQQPLTQLIACTGSAGCAKGLADTKADAVQLAALLHAPGAPGTLHLSGCRRSCAAAHVAPVTLLAVAPGYYDFYLRDAVRSGFGRLHASHISVQEAGALLNARLRSNTDD